MIEHIAFMFRRFNDPLHLFAVLPHFADIQRTKIMMITLIYQILPYLQKPYIINREVERIWNILQHLTAHHKV